MALINAGDEVTGPPVAGRVRVRRSGAISARKATCRILDTPASGLIHLHSVAQPNVAAILPSAGPRSLRPAHQAADAMLEAHASCARTRYRQAAWPWIR